MRKVAVFLFVGALAVSCARRIKEDAFVYDKNLREGLFAELRGEYDEAKRIFSSSADRYWGGLLLADLYFYRFRDYEKALKEVEAVEKITNPKSPKAEEVLYRKALILENLGRYPEAGKIYEKVAVDFPQGKYFESATEAVEEMFRRNFPETLAVFKGGFVSRMMLEWALEQIPPFQRGRFNTPEGKKELVERLAIEEMALREAEALRLDTTKMVREHLEGAKKRFLRQAYYTYGVAKRVKISEEELKAYYNSHKEDYRVPGKVEIVRVALKDSAEAYKVLQRVKSGEALDSLARDTLLNVLKSEARIGGKLTIYDTYEGQKDLYEEASKRDTGEVFVFKKDTLWMVVKLLSKSKPRYKTFDEVKNTIKNLIKSKRENELYTKDRERLKEFYGVRVFIKRDTAEPQEEKRERGEKKRKKSISDLLQELPDTVAVIERLSVVITDRDVAKRLERLSERYREMYMTPSGVLNLLENGMLPEILEVAEAELRRYYLHYPVYKKLKKAYRDAMLTALYEKLVREKVKLSEDSLRAYYEKNKKDFYEEGRINLQRIVVKSRPEAYRLIRKLRSGKVNADSLAKALTDIKGEKMTSGRTTITEKSEPDFYKKAMKAPLKKWRVTRLKDGRWAVYRVFHKKKGRLKSFEEVKRSIEFKLRREIESRIYQEALEYLKKKYALKVFEDRIEELGGKEEEKEGK